MVTPALVQDLQWWNSSHNLTTGRPFQYQYQSTEVQTNVSTTRWGATCADLQIHQTWSPQERVLHINMLELLAIFKAFRAFEPLLCGKMVQLITDNTTALFYVNKQGGTQSLPLLHLTLRFWEWCLTRNIFPNTIHIMSQENVIPDKLSRHTYNTHEWTLHQQTFKFLLCCRWGHPVIDLFATPYNKKCSWYCSQAECNWYCSRAGLGQHLLGNVFSINWKGGLV
ncbi:hypothetical protein JRQ81_001253, partial [Phrynocephalus forsythii]